MAHYAIGVARLVDAIPSDADLEDAVDVALKLHAAGLTGAQIGDDLEPAIAEAKRLRERPRLSDRRYFSNDAIGSSGARAWGSR